MTQIAERRMCWWAMVTSSLIAHIPEIKTCWDQDQLQDSTACQGHWPNIKIWGTVSKFLRFEKRTWHLRVVKCRYQIHADLKDVLTMLSRFLLIYGKLWSFKLGLGIFLRGRVWFHGRSFASPRSSWPSVGPMTQGFLGGLSWVFYG